MLPSWVSPKYPSVDWKSPNSRPLDTSNSCIWDQTRHLPPQTCSFSRVPPRSMVLPSIQSPKRKLGVFLPPHLSLTPHIQLLARLCLFFLWSLPSLRPSQPSSPYYSPGSMPHFSSIPTLGIFSGRFFCLPAPLSLGSGKFTLPLVPSSISTHPVP